MFPLFEITSRRWLMASVNDLTYNLSFTKLKANWKELLFYMYSFLGTDVQFIIDGSSVDKWYWESMAAAAGYMTWPSGAPDLSPWMNIRDFP